MVLAEAVHMLYLLFDTVRLLEGDNFFTAPPGEFFWSQTVLLVRL